jgi:hypothetical protein
MNLETELRHALERESPPPGFSARVLARIQAEEAAPARSPRRWIRAVAASLTLTVLAGGWAAWQVHERREGERAREQVLLAMRIAGRRNSPTTRQLTEMSSQETT